MHREPLGVYVHVPFCGARCDYCDFAIVAGADHRSDEYVELLCREIRTMSGRLGARRVDTVHFGGGTPSRLTPVQLGTVIDTLRSELSPDPGLQIGLEANPEDVSAERVEGWLRVGVTRLSIGVQALTDRGLASIGRPGTADEGRRALVTARRSGMRDLGADLIYGRPGQTVREWAAEIEEIAALDVDHLSAYALETLGRTPLVRAIEAGRAAAPDPDLQADMYELTEARLADAGFMHYEISNFARPGHASVHNMKYWTDQPYLGLGQSAASYVDGCRWTNARRYGEYRRVVRAGGVAQPVEPYDPGRRAGEALTLGLRLVGGVDLAEVARRHGEAAVAARRPGVERGLERGLLGREGSRIALSERGRLLADEVFVDLL